VKPGHIYLLKNSAYKDTYHKIGKTAGTVENRARKLSQPTGVPSEFRIVYQHYVTDCDKAESDAKERLKKFRVHNTEFYDLPQNEAIKVLIDVVEEINKSAPELEDDSQAGFFLREVSDLFDSGVASSLSGDEFKLRILDFVSWFSENGEGPLTTKSYSEKTGIPESQVGELLKRLRIRPLEELRRIEQEAQNEAMREIEEEQKRRSVVE
jgi:hypothetical protein